MFTTHFTENGPPPARRDSNTPSYQQQLLLAQQQVAAQQQAQQQQQGMVNMFPTQAGHQLDLNHLWQQVQELSAILAANRESTQGLVRRADEIRNRPDLVNVAGVNGVNGVNGTTQADLEATNQALRSENAELRAENEDLSLLAQDYESVLEKVLEGLRVYARDHAASTINIHQTYTNQLNSERAQNAQLRQQETDNQMRLATISKLLREAYRDEGGEGLEVVVEALKVENKVLREALGLPVEDGEESLSL